MSAPGRYLVRHPLPGEPKVWRVIDAATGRSWLTTNDYDDARRRCVQLNEAWFAEPDARDYPAGHEV